MDIVIKKQPLIFLIEKENLLSKKRKPFSSNIQNINISHTPDKNKIETNLISNRDEKKFELKKNSNETDLKTKENIQKGKWSKEEDFLLEKYVKKYGEGKWNIIERCLIGRTRKQIRQRYISNIKIKKIYEDKNEINNNNYSISSSSEEEEYSRKERGEEKIVLKWDENLDRILLKEYFLNKKSWVKIAKKIPGSSENSVKNRFYSLLRQKVNKIKKEYKKKYLNNYTESKVENSNNSVLLLIKKEIFGNKNINNLENTKELLFTKLYFDTEFYSNKSKKRNYSTEILLEFLPELLLDKGIDLNEIINELKERKNIAAKQIFIVIEKHFEICDDSVNNDYNSISTDIEIENIKNAQSEKLGQVIKNMKLKIMYKYFHRFRYNTLGI